MKHSAPGLILQLVLSAASHAAPLTITASNPLQVARSRETLEIPAADLQPLGVANLNEVHIQDGDGNELVCQAIDLDGDPLRSFDAVLFQADFAPGETRTFTASAGAKQLWKAADYKAYGRFVRERFDDFAWENDLIGHRTYGRALETWEGEPLSSSTIDVWSKRTPRLLLNEWYLTDDYHADHGEGADFYSAGLSRGCGGSGLWADDKLWVSRNFIHSNVLANGPIRVLFELEYAPYAVGPISVTETKRISLDAGSQFDRFELRYQPFTRPGTTAELTAGIGLKKVPGEEVSADPAAGWLAKWEPMEKNAGRQGLAVIVDPADFVKTTEDELNHLVLAKVGEDRRVVYHAGFAWDKAGRFTDAAAWRGHVAATAAALAAPIQVRTGPAQAQVDDLSGWPAEAQPAVIGKRIATNVLARKFRYETTPAKAKLGVIYPEVISWYGALSLADLTSDDALRSQLVARFEPYLSGPASAHVNPAAHVDYRVFGAVPLEIHLQTRDERMKSLGLRMAEAQWENPTPDGITAEARYWIDDMYMIPLLQTQAYRATGERKYLDRAALAMAAYFDKLQQPNGLFHHGTDSPYFWGRGNGWMAAGSAELLRSLPADHPLRPRILTGVRKMMTALLEHQRADGMWRQLIDQAGSWPEASGSAMFTFAMVTGVKGGWLEPATYGPAARKAWLALVSRVDEEGNLHDVCIGTDKGHSEAFYNDRPRTAGDLHGQAPMLWTASALLR